jgi:hypothetical protein
MSRYGYFTIRIVQQGFCNPVSNNLGFVEESGSKTGSFAFYQKKASSLKQSDHRGMFKTTSNSVCTSVVSPDPLSLTLSTS